MERNRRGRGFLALELEILGFLVHADQIVAVLEDRLDDVVGGLLVHALVRHQQVHDGRLLVVRVHSLVRFLGDRVLDVQIAVFPVHRRHQVRVIDELDLHAGRERKVRHRRRRQAADPEKSVDLAVLERVRGFGDAEALALHVLVLVQARRFDDAECHHLGGAATGAGGHALALEVGHPGDAGAFDRHHVHAVRIHHHERAHRDRLAGELVLALERIQAGIDHGHRQVGLARADQLQVGDRPARHLGGGLHPGHEFRQHRSHAAAEGVIDAAGAAGRYGNILRLRAKRNCTGKQQRDTREVFHFLSSSKD